MIVCDVAVVCQVLKTTCTISIWILAFAGPKKWRFPIQYWIFLKKYPLQTTSQHPQKIWKTCSNQSNQSNQKYSTFKRTAIWTSRKGAKWSTGILSVSFWIISFTGTSSSSITGRTWKACQVWRTTLVSVCKSTWIWFEKCDSHAKPRTKIWKVQSLSRYGEHVSFQNLVNIEVHMSMWLSFSGGYCQDTEHFYVT